MCSGPYHAATSSGSVHARDTCSRGASKMCVIRISRSGALAGVESVVLRADRVAHRGMLELPGVRELSLPPSALSAG
jgi:hypothetical protein